MSIAEVPEPLPEIAIPPNLSRHQLLGHVRRIAVFSHEHAVRRPPASPRDREAWAALPRFALGLSWVVDLGLLRPNTGAISDAAWPRRWSMYPKPSEAVKIDVPRFEPGEPRIMDHSCQAGQGPQGGKCRHSTQPVRQVVNESAGDYVLVWACAEHAAPLRAMANRAPVPSPNRGGLLAAVFPEVDMDAIYRWADGRYDPGQPTDEPELSQPVRLRLIPGGVR